MEFLLVGFCVLEFRKLNPIGYVPVLVDGDIVVSDSFAILLVSLLVLVLSISLFCIGYVLSFH